MEKGSRWKKHFDRSQASLEHPDPARFVRGPWHPGPGPSVRAPFLAFRITMSILFLAGLGWSCADHWDSGKWLVFLTNWGFLTCTVQSLLATYLVLQEYRKQRSANPGESTFNLTADEKQMPLSYKIYWVLYNMALPVALFITILYWTILYKPNDDSAAGSKGPFFLNFVVHAANSILCLVELAVGGPPSRFLHVFQPVLYSTVYIAFNVIYWAAGGLGPLDNHYIYPVLDWDNNPNLGVGIVFGGAALLVVIHAVICALSELRTMVAHRLRKRKENNIGISTLPTLSTGNFNKGFVP